MNNKETTAEWAEILRAYRMNHTHDYCNECDPQAVAETHLMACYEAQDQEEYGDCEDSEVSVESPAFGPFCGCLTCVVREVLMSAMPALIHQLTHKPSPTRDALQREFDRS